MCVCLHYWLLPMVGPSCPNLYKKSIHKENPAISSHRGWRWRTCADRVCKMFATNDLIASRLSFDGPIKQVESCERDRWRGLILTTEEISEIEDKGLALHWEWKNLISDPLGCSSSPPSRLSTATEWLHSSLSFIWQPDLSAALLRINQKPR